MATLGIFQHCNMQLEEASFLEGNGNPLQCSCLENPRDGRAWWAAVYGIAQSRTQLKQLSSSTFLEGTGISLLVPLRCK